MGVFALAQDSFHLGSRFIPWARQKAGICVELDAELGMAQAVLDYLRLDPLRENPAGGRSSQIVEPDDWQPGLGKNLPEAVEPLSFSYRVEAGALRLL